MRVLILFCLGFQFFSCGLPARYQKTENTERLPIVLGSVPNSDRHLLNFVQSWIGTPYLYGGMSRQGVDCSGFTSIIFAEVYQLKIPRTAMGQYQEGIRLREGDLQAGDLVFFRRIRSRGIDHVGIVIQKNQFAHATESSGVIFSDLNEEYYKNRYCGARRFLSE